MDRRSVIQQAIPMPQFTKSDFIHYLNCPKSLWLKKRKPTLFPEGGFSAFQKKLVRDGFAVEAHVWDLIATRRDAEKFSSQWVFECSDGLFARADLVRANKDGTLDLFEIKSSSHIKDRAPDFQLKDVTFQAIVAERCGFIRGELPRDDVAAVIVQDRAEIEPAPADDIQVGEVGLPIAR